MEVMSTSLGTCKKSELKEHWMKNLNGVDMLMHGLIKVKKGISDPFEMEKELGYIELYSNINHNYFFGLLKETEIPTLKELIANKLYCDDLKSKYPEIVEQESINLESDSNKNEKVVKKRKRD